MALSIKLSLLLAFVLFYSFKMISPAECSGRAGWLDNKAAASKFSNRLQYYEEMFYKLKRKSKRDGSDDDDKYEDMVEWDLRKVPAGPDPLHHNGGGGGPKKPRTP